MMEGNQKLRKVSGNKLNHSQSQEIICNIHKFMKREAQEDPILLKKVKKELPKQQVCHEGLFNTS